MSLDKKNSTAKLLTKEKPKIVNNHEDKFESVLFLQKAKGRKGEGGLRTKGYFKKSYDGKPLISIITVVYNGEKYLEETIQSVLNQTYDNVEYIIIDGGSTDGTVDIIKKYEDKVDYWVSEKDKNMYDGINKGLKLATGDVIACLNSDDRYYDKNVIASIVNYMNKNQCDGVYGNIVRYYQDSGRKIEKKIFQINFKKLLLSKHSTFMPQPALFIKRNIYKKLDYFDINYKYASDYDFNLRCIKDFNIKYFEKSITLFRQHSETITSTSYIEFKNEIKNILIKHGINNFNVIDRHASYYIYWLKYKFINIF